MNGGKRYMNKEIRCVRLNGHSVAITLANTTEELVEKLIKRAKRYSDSGFKTEVKHVNSYKKVCIVFDEPNDAKSMFQYITGIMYS